MQTHTAMHTFSRAKVEAFRAGLSVPGHQVLFFLNQKVYQLTSICKQVWST